MDPLVGQILGQYELQDRLGHGGMAAVYRALQPALGRSVAVKVLPLGHIPDPTLPARFRREARLAANLMHPNIVPVYDFGEWQGYLYIVMALIVGGTLKDRMQGPMPAESAVRLVGQVADALGYAHGQGIFHRDVKPANILLSAVDWAMLSDFGIARTLGETTRLTGPYGTIGTPAYMAPEQWLGGEIDGRADLYSLGIVLYELLSGSPPFTATTAQGLMRQHLEVPVPPLPTHRTDLAAGFDDILQVALAKEPDRRFRHAVELKTAIEAVLRTARPTGVTFGTHVDAGLGPVPTSPHVGQTIRVPHLPGHDPVAEPNHRTRGSVPIGVGILVLVLVVLLAGALGYILAGGRAQLIGGQEPPPAAAVAKVATEVPAPMPPTSIPPPPPTVTVPLPTATSPPAPAPTTPAATAQPIAPAQVVPTATAASDPRFAIVERHVGEYFAALNAGDFARAQAVCCTPAWRAKYPLDEWRKNFIGVSDLRFATPFRYTAVEPGRIVAEVDYSFANSSGVRQFWTLRWTFVPVGGGWLADEATAARQ